MCEKIKIKILGELINNKLIGFRSPLTVFVVLRFNVCAYDINYLQIYIDIKVLMAECKQS